MGAAGGGDKVYVDDVFNPFLYAGTDGALTGNSGLDLSGEGGMIWIKNRTDSGRNHQIFDTERGVNKTIAITTGAEGTNSNFNQTFTSTGFTLNNDYANYNQSTKNYCAWNFRKAKGFFDVVTYTGNGSSSGQEVAHSLGSVPGCVIIKCLQSNDAHAKANNWIFYHRSLSDQHFLYWNVNENEDGAGWFQKSDVTSTYVRVPKSGGNTAQTDTMNRNGYSYVMYLFAHDEQSFGEGGDQSIIKCGNFTGNGNSGDYGPFVTLGWEPQFVMVKSAGDDADWNVFDSMRGIVSGGNDNKLKTENANLESTNQDWLDVHATGFRVRNAGNEMNGSGENIVYVAIRRPDGYVGKPPELGTDVFSLATGTNNTNPGFVSGFPVDLSLRKIYASSGDWFAASRLTGTNYLSTNSTAAETSNSNQTFDFQNGVGKWGGDLTTYMSWQWKRHAGFDVVAYTSPGGNSFSVNHSLGKIPEMMFIKRRSSAGANWTVYHKGLNGGTNPEQYGLHLNLTSSEIDDSAFFNDFAPNATTFQLGFDGSVGTNGESYLAMLFASVDGISKVGYYSGDGTSNGSKAITVGFQPRFVIIKSSSYNGGEWQVLDTTRGIDNGLQLNSSNAQSSDDFIDLTSTGFTMKSSHNDVNGSSQEYIYYAHA